MGNAGMSSPVSGVERMAFAKLAGRQASRRQVENWTEV
ncbi:hypothetical protein BURMUCF2_0959 [Burkholderia multivorans CF2]|nr:hypothetical protein BURMUCF2_0959 [Burkholderia multivorans CF2]